MPDVGVDTHTNACKKALYQQLSHEPQTSSNILLINGLQD
jgi:hypothetical protein